ncbi:MAG: hypothetical protein SGPRY_004529 [Prymnesium sp.]
MLAGMDETRRATPPSREEAGPSAGHATGETSRKGGRTSDPTLAQEQRKGFERALDDLCAEERSQFLTKEKYEEILDCLLGWNSMGNTSERKAKYSQGYAWIKKYTVVKSGGVHLVCIDPDTLEQRKLTEAQAGRCKRCVEAYIVVSHRNRIFDDIHGQHVEGGHCKNKALYDRVFKVHGDSISHKIQVHMRSR